MYNINVETILQYGARLMILFMVIPLHEFAHAWSAYKMGDQTPKAQNRLNLNPFNHLDPIGAVLIFFTGFGWGKPVVVNPLRFKNQKKGMALSAAAGPIANVIAAFVGVIIYKVLFFVFLTNPSETISWVILLFRYFTTLNLGLAIFNLIPVPPLDGSKILGYFTSYNFDKKVQQYSLYILIGFALLVFTGALDTPLGYMNSGLLWVLDKLTFWVDPIMKAILKIG